MKMIGLFRITLLPGTDVAAFTSRITGVMTGVETMQSTRITRGFNHSLLERQSGLREFVWEVRADLMTDHGYDFAANLDRVQNALEGQGVVSAMEVYRSIGV